MILLWIVGLVVFVSFFLIVFRGAPWVPTLTSDVKELFTLHTFKENEVLVDLGSGDGRVVLEAAKRGVHSVGYELNPFLVALSNFRLRKYKNASVRLEDIWSAKLPEDTAIVFVFLAKPFMMKLDDTLTSEAKRLGHDILLVSYAMEIPGKKINKKHGALIMYEYKA